MPRSRRGHYADWRPPGLDGRDRRLARRAIIPLLPTPIEASPSDPIGHYRIRQKLGSGGMGDVYLAEDDRLRRLVALKVLPVEVARDPQRRMRFLQEAHAASALSHPNVSTIHEVGQEGESVFIAMEYIEGKTLGQLRQSRTVSVEEVLDIALQTADALDEAQARGIVHRDIKSANIMITPRGHVKVLDFGLAKLVAQETDPNDEATKIKTSAGLVVGTPSYMSPEQALGRPVDHRSDLFSLGVVLYELVTGKLPFVGTTSTETIEKIAHSEPEPMARFNYALPPELERIIRKLLEKEPERRYQSARDLIVDLKNLKRDSTSGEVASRRAPATPRRARVVVTAGAALAVALVVAALALRPWERSAPVAEDRIDSIAVLPFLNASGDAESEYLSDGISESIIADLARLDGVRVVPRSTVFRYKGKDDDPQTAAQALNVRAIVAGRVLQRGGRLSVSAELIDAKSNAQLWGARYERNAADALAIQEEISKQIAERIRGGTGAPAFAGASGAMTRDPEAYQLYLKGRYHWNKRTGESIQRALEYFEQAVARDPRFALAHAGVADSYIILEQYAERPPQEMLASAEAATRKALAIDPGIAEAHASMAQVLMGRRQWAAAEREFKRAIELNPNYPTARHWYNIYLRQAGRVDEALVQITKAQELDPLSMIIGVNMVDVLFILDRDEEALRTAEKYLEIDPNFPQLLGIVSTLYSNLGRHADAVATAKKAVQSSGEVTEQLANLASAYAAAGDRAATLTTVRRIEERIAAGRADPYFLAIAQAALGEREKALDALEQSVERGSTMVLSANVEPRLRALKSNPRFARLVGQLGLSG